MKIKTNCRTCDKVIETTASRVKDGRGRYCSKRCRSKAVYEKVKDSFDRTGVSPWNKGLNVQLNTGRTHFKKGQSPWNKGLSKETDDRVAAYGLKTRGAKNRGYKNGKTKVNGGYIKVLAHDHPHKDSSGYVMEHRLIVEAEIGRYLDPNEVVHHIDKNTSNNGIENLYLFMSGADHTRYHHGVKRGEEPIATSNCIKRHVPRSNNRRIVRI